jgi:hypothetical protein
MSAHYMHEEKSTSNRGLTIILHITSRQKLRVSMSYSNPSPSKAFLKNGRAKYLPVVQHMQQGIEMLPSLYTEAKSVCCYIESVLHVTA